MPFGTNNSVFNRPFFLYSWYWTWTRLQWRLMRVNIIKKRICVWINSLRWPPLQASSSPKLRIWIFTTVASNLAIWLANLPLSIRIQTTLLAPVCHTMSFSARALKKSFLWCWYCGKKTNHNCFLPQYQCQRKLFSIVCTLIENATCHHSGPCESTTFWPLRWRILVIDTSTDNEINAIWPIASCTMAHSLQVLRLNSVQNKRFVPWPNNVCN